MGINQVILWSVETWFSSLLFWPMDPILVICKHLQFEVGKL